MALFRFGYFGRSSKSISTVIQIVSTVIQIVWAKIHKPNWTIQNYKNLSKSPKKLSKTALFWYPNAQKGDLDTPKVGFGWVFWNPNRLFRHPKFRFGWLKSRFGYHENHKNTHRNKDKNASFFDIFTFTIPPKIHISEYKPANECRPITSATHSNRAPHTNPASNAHDKMFQPARRQLNWEQWDLSPLEQKAITKTC